MSAPMDDIGIAAHWVTDGELGGMIGRRSHSVRELEWASKILGPRLEDGNHEAIDRKGLRVALDKIHEQWSILETRMKNADAERASLERAIAELVKTRAALGQENADTWALLFDGGLSHEQSLQIQDNQIEIRDLTRKLGEEMAKITKCNKELEELEELQISSVLPRAYAYAEKQGAKLRVDLRAAKASKLAAEASQAGAAAAAEASRVNVIVEAEVQSTKDVRDAKTSKNLPVHLDDDKLRQALALFPMTKFKGSSGCAAFFYNGKCKNGTRCKFPHDWQIVLGHLIEGYLHHKQSVEDWSIGRQPTAPVTYCLYLMTKGDCRKQVQQQRCVGEHDATLHLIRGMVKNGVRMARETAKTVAAAKQQLDNAQWVLEYLHLDD